MTRFGKVLAFFVLVVSLSFMGIAAVTALGGVNWDDEQKKLLSEYAFEEQPGEQPTWNVKARSEHPKTAKVSSTSGLKSLAAAVVWARDDQLKTEKARLALYTEQTSSLLEQAKDFSEKVRQDLAAMQARGDALDVELAQVNKEYAQLADEVITIADKTRATLRTSAARREEVFRLQNQLDEIRTDLFQIREQQQRLRDLLVRTGSVSARLKRRQLQLVKSGAQGSYEQDPPAPATKPGNEKTPTDSGAQQ